MVGPTRENFDATVVSITWSSDQTLWYPVLARSSSQQHGAKENVCTPRMETNVAPLCSQDVKIQQKGVSRHYLTPDIVARTIRHHLVAAFHCSANIYV